MLIALFILICIIALLFWFTSSVDKKIEKSFFAPGKLTTVKEGTIHWQQQGSGPALILIHGLLGNSANFANLASLLAKRYTVYSIDRPGNGFSLRSSTASASFEKQSSMIFEWMDKVGLNSAYLVGHSMGGGISLRMAIDAPERIKAVSLLCPLTAPLNKGAGPLSILYIPNGMLRKGISKTLASPFRVKFGSKQLAQIFHPESIPPSFVKREGGALALHSRCFYEGSKDTVAAQGSLKRQVPEYAGITCPVGVLYGGSDTILEPNSHIQPVVSAVSGAVSEIIEGAGHMIPITQPQHCADFINAVNDKVH